jgi:hypothetical protein
MNFKYLGVEVTSDGALKSEVKHQAYKLSDFLDVQMTQYGRINI